jgi:hypothetical protein
MLDPIVADVGNREVGIGPRVNDALRSLLQEIGGRRLLEG